MYKEIINQVKKQLNNELPGIHAQQKMSPSVRFTGNVFPNKELARESSVLVLLYIKSNALYIPFIQRPIYSGAHSGQISLPGGKSEITDPNLLYTALRETHEEIGINSENIEILGSLTPTYIPNSNYNVTPYVGFYNGEPKFKPDTFEVANIIEASLEILISSNTISTFKKEINGIKITAPYYNIDGYQIWGATAMIISELKEIILQTPLIISLNSYNVRNAPKSQ